MSPWLLMAPLFAGTVLYVLQAAGYVVLDRPGMCVAFIGYALANAGLIYDALTYIKGG